MPFTRRGLVVFPALAIAVSVSCATGDTAATTAATLVDVVQSPSTTVPKGSTTRTVPRVAAAIPVARERSTGYRREMFRHWVDEDGDGCNTREEVLIAESSTPAQVDPYGCKVIAGDWYSPYDGVAHTDPADLDIDHLVPLKEAWDSGAHSWTAAKRRAYANDLSDARSLIAVTAGENRSKGDKDPSNWMPDRREYWCTYVADWIAVKSRWGLSMDQSEAARVRRIAATCATTPVPAWGTATQIVAPSVTPGQATPVRTSPTPSTNAPASTVSPQVGTTAPLSAVVTTVPVASVPATTATTATTAPTTESLPEGVPGRFCTPEGAVGSYKGDPVVCSRTKADGTTYVDNRARWVRS